MAFGGITAVFWLLVLTQVYGGASLSSGTADGMERWGYVEVRPKAHIFWWYIQSLQRVSSPMKPWPTILWLQGGPGQSGIGQGNFAEIGPLDVDLNPHNSTWRSRRVGRVVGRGGPGSGVLTSREGLAAGLATGRGGASGGALTGQEEPAVGRVAGRGGAGSGALTSREGSAAGLVGGRGGAGSSALTGREGSAAGLAAGRIGAGSGALTHREGSAAGLAAGRVGAGGGALTGREELMENPVGVGFSYVDDLSTLAKTNLQAAKDLAELLKELAKEIPTLQSSPLFLVGESYGSKLAARSNFKAASSCCKTGVLVARAIRAGTLELTLGGVVLGDSWISPDDYALSYPWLLEGVSRLDDNAVGKGIMMAVKVKQQMAAGQFVAAYTTWVNLLDMIDSRSGNVNMENFVLDTTVSSVLSDSAARPLLSPGNSQAANNGSNTVSDTVNGFLKQKFKIIPKDFIWQEVSLQVFDALANDFMKPAINEVDELLSYGVNVTVYNGQRMLWWDGLHNILSLPRKPLHYCHPYYLTNGFVRSYKNLLFYWILGAGHKVCLPIYMTISEAKAEDLVPFVLQLPVDKPSTAPYMISSIVQYPAN
ncbi:hypothetical protein SETIT_7G010900v2 [Setaria italica]|uniref:Carboxypeptidase n=1 Tax=Setaria italica TaxID=4555 RepID=A0A368RQN4_SETIT|nr:hypothetical protein SETIT_7G010900v2 [Setaria italica]